MEVRARRCRPAHLRELETKKLAERRELGFIILRHPDWRTANALAGIAANDITMYAE